MERDPSGRYGAATALTSDPEIRRIADGDDGHGFLGLGEHRGRGPKNYTRSDERIREDVNDRLSDDSWLDAGEIEVQVKDGEVTLNGKVNSRNDKRRAEDLAEAVSGVKHLQNNLRVQSSDQGMASGNRTADQNPVANPSGGTIHRA